MADTTLKGTVESSPEGAALVNMADSIKSLTTDTGDTLKSAGDTFGSMLASELASSPVLALGLGLAKSASKDMFSAMTGAKARDEEKAKQDKEKEDNRLKLEASNVERELLAREKSADGIERVEMETAKVTDGVDRLIDIWDGNKSTEIERKRESENAQEELIDAIEGIGIGGDGRADEDDGGIPFTFTGLGIATMLKGFGKTFAAGAFMLLKKLFLPLAIVTSLVNGLYSAFEAWNDSEGKEMSTRVYETLRDFFGGVIEAITFGMIDKETFANFIDDSPLKKFFTVTIPDVFDSLISGMWEMVARISRDLVPDDVLAKMDKVNEEKQKRMDDELQQTLEDNRQAERIRKAREDYDSEMDKRLKESALISSQLAATGDVSKIELSKDISEAIKSGDIVKAYALAKSTAEPMTSNKGMDRVLVREEMSEAIRSNTNQNAQSSNAIVGSGNVDNSTREVVNNYNSPTAVPITRQTLQSNMQ